MQRTALRARKIVAFLTVRLGSNGISIYRCAAAEALPVRLHLAMADGDLERGIRVLMSLWLPSARIVTPSLHQEKIANDFMEGKNPSCTS